jgi:hypothetical protein
LASLFDRHSQIAATPETHFFSRFCNKRVPRGMRLFRAEELAELFAECQYTRDLQLSAEQLLERTGRREIALDEFYRVALDTFASMRRKPFWVEKTPEHLLCADQIFAWYPEARMICIYRDGRDTALSCRNMPWSITPVRHYGAVWRQSAIAMLRCQSKWPENFLAIRYESLLAEPVETLNAVMKFAGVEFEPQQLDASLGTGIVPAWEMSVKQNVFSEIDPSRAYAWKRTASSSQLRALNSIMRPYLAQLGYEPGDDRSIWPVRLYDAAINRAFRVAFSYKMYWVRWWIRILLNPLIPNSPHASLKEVRKRSANHSNSEPARAD